MSLLGGGGLFFFFLGGCCFDKVAKSEFLNGNLPAEVLADILCF